MLRPKEPMNFMRNRPTLEWNMDKMLLRLLHGL